MKNVNHKRIYSNFQQFNDCCYTALHETVDKFCGDEGAVIRTGGEIDFVYIGNSYINNKHKIDKNTARMISKARSITATKEERLDWDKPR